MPRYNARIGRTARRVTDGPQCWSVLYACMDGYREGLGRGLSQAIEIVKRIAVACSGGESLRTIPLVLVFVGHARLVGLHRRSNRSTDCRSLAMQAAHQRSLEASTSSPRCLAPHTARRRPAKRCSAQLQAGAVRGATPAHSSPDSLEVQQDPEGQASVLAQMAQGSRSQRGPHAAPANPHRPPASPASRACRCEREAGRERGQQGAEATGVPCGASAATGR